MNDIEPLAPEDQHAELLASGASGVHFFQGQQLEPFSWGRMNALFRIMKEELSTTESNAAIVYLCTLPAGKVSAIRGETARTAFFAALEEWAEKKGIRPGSSASRELAETADAIWAEYTAAQTEPQLKGGVGSGEPSLVG